MPRVADVSTVVGYSMLDGSAKSNSAFFIVLLKPFDERTGAGDSAQVSIIAKLRPSSQRSASANVIAFNLPPIIGLGTGGGFEYQLQICTGGEPARLAAVRAA